MDRILMRTSNSYNVSKISLRFVKSLYSERKQNLIRTRGFIVRHAEMHYVHRTTKKINICSTSFNSNGASWHYFISVLAPEKGHSSNSIIFLILKYHIVS